MSRGSFQTNAEELMDAERKSTSMRFFQVVVSYYLDHNNIFDEANSGLHVATSIGLVCEHTPHGKHDQKLEAGTSYIFP